MIDVVKSKNFVDRLQKLKKWFDMKKLWIMCLSLFAIVLSSGASHAGLSLDRCSPFSRWVITGISTQISMKHTTAWNVIGMKTKPSLLFAIHIMNLRWSLPTKRRRMGNGAIWQVLPLDTVIVFLALDQSLSLNRLSELRINWTAAWWFTARPLVFREITLSVWKYLYSNN